MEAVFSSLKEMCPGAIQAMLFRRSTPHANPWSCNATVLAIGIGYALVFQLLRWTKFTEPSGLTLPNRLTWHSRILSSLSAVILLSVTLLAFPEAWAHSVEERYFGYCWAQDLAARLFAGYLIFDLSWMVRYQPIVKDSDFIPYAIHHILFLAITCYALSGSYFKFHFMWLIASEASNPFVNLRWHLAVMGKKGTPYVINGLVATLIFFSFRVVLWGYMLTVIYTERHVWMSESAPKLFPLIISSIYFGYLLQLYWFALIVKGMIRAIARQTPDHQAHQDDPKKIN